MTTITPTSYRWPHRLALLAALVTFPLIWVGGLVTSYDAGMAVPDWPGTYGYNMFAYPLTTWLGADWDLFIEHGHRLLGAVAGLLMIALVVSTFVTRTPLWLKQFAGGLLGLVILQGVMGGARVVLDERLVALLHGCTGPVFFVSLVAFALVTSARFPFAGPQQDAQPAARLATATWGFAAVCYLQLVLGALVRHVPVTSTAGFFRAVMLLHVVFAIMILAQAVLLGVTIIRAKNDRSVSRWVGWSLLLLVTLQIGLGVMTYVTKYSWPEWMGSFQFAASHVNYEKSALQAILATAHVANGSLILATAVIMSLQASRNWRPAAVLATAAPLLLVRPTA
ncbi:heme A synthase [Anatilimnocola sp. NA78]|uniref:COX15/CtaA family protein n=1 Tax=Anatilimnocola sp. NA78 TaxID=3415683 RepID=UPI003CE56420